MQIYIHIPFCEQKCGYCRFASVWKIQNLHIAKYVDFLCKEINKGQTHRSAPTKNNVGVNLCVHPKTTISTIYFWWWTPWVLSLEQLESIFTALKNKFIFSNNIEISLESTPDKITKRNLEWWDTLWINRLSMWVQTLNLQSLETIWRGNKWDIERALDIIGQTHRSAPTKNNVGVNLCVHPLNISLDFIIWLPHVAQWEIKKDIEYILNKYSFIKHISVYMLEDYYSPDKIKPHPSPPLTREGIDQEINSKFQKITYPEDWWEMWITEEQYLWEYSEVKKYLESQWFKSYEISNYAEPWFECKHNQWYWNHSTVLWFWLWAYWFVNNIRYANSENFSEYYEWKRILETKLNSEDIFLETVMFQLRTSWLRENIYKELNQEKLKCFISEWYLNKKSDKIVLSDKWVLVMDYILWEIV